LHLQNGDDVLHKLHQPDGRLLTLLKSGKTDAEVIDELSLATLSKPATAEVKAAVKTALAAPGADREEVFRDLFWAYLNSTEFSFNH
jgi:hypothetical protein